MTDDLPRRPIPPLDPRPGQFEAVLERAHARRHRRTLRVIGVAAVFLAGMTGGMSIDGGVRTVPRALVDLATGPQTATSEPPQDSTAAARTPEVTEPAETKQRTADTSSPPPSATASTSGPAPALMLRGRALRPDGSPVAGLLVYPGVADAGTFRHVAEPAAVTARDGTFSLPCPGTPVLLAPWPLGEDAGERAATAAWAATFVGGATDPGSATVPACVRGDVVTDVTLERGSAITGTLTVASACDDGRPLRLLVDGDEALAVRVDGLRDGDVFRIGGLPAGRHVVVSRGQEEQVLVGGSETTERDLVLDCSQETPSPTPSTTPTIDPSPSSTPSGSGTPQPSPTATTPPLPTPSTSPPQ